MSPTEEASRQVCFVNMPYGHKADPTTGSEIDFDAIYANAIEPAVVAAGLRPVRSDQETTGGVIHSAMFARLLLSEFVIADLTTANPNVFYELGVRHTAKPYTTIPIFATIGDLPFDVSLVRAIPYHLTDGTLGDDEAAALRAAITERIRSALTGPLAGDSPLFEFFTTFPGIEMSHEVTDVFRDRVEYSDHFRTRLAAATAEGTSALRAVEDELGEASTAERGVLMDLYLSYRDVEAFDDMIRLYERFPADLQSSVVARQQLALALNRRGRPGDVDRAVSVIDGLIEQAAGSAETYGILGRIHKDAYRRATEAGDDVAAPGFLDQAIDAYRRGFLAEPVDFYPGVNAVNLLVQKGTDEAMAEAADLAPMVTFAAVRQGGAESSDYWTVATVVELAAVDGDDEMLGRLLPRLVTLGAEPWMYDTTADNLQAILDGRRGQDGTAVLERVVTELRSRAEAGRAQRGS